MSKFDDANAQNWQLKFDAPGNDDWRTKWALDGERASIRDTEKGMVFSAGPNRGDHACHAVIWTQASFSGDLKVSFDYTRLDTVNRFVNIIYFQAQGVGEGPYDKDIHTWRDRREIPYMQTYFKHMDLLHVSYAAFGNENDEPEDYIRVRRYPVRPDRTFQQIEVEGTEFNTGVFRPGVTYHMCFIKTDKVLLLRITGEDVALDYEWDVSTVDPVTDGPIGIRHMWEKCSRYRNFQVFERA